MAHWNTTRRFRPLVGLCLAGFLAVCAAPGLAGEAGAPLFRQSPLPKRAIFLEGGRAGTDPADASVTLQTRGVELLDLSVFRIGDPVAFFLTQSDLKRPSLENPALRVALASAAAAHPGADPAGPNPFGFAMIRCERIRPPGGKGGGEIPLGLDRSGTYLVEAAHGDRVAYAVVEVGRLVLLVVRAEKETLAFCADAETGAPVAGADVAAGIGGKEVGRGKTGEDGTVRLAVPYDPRVVVAASSPLGAGADDPTLFPSGPEGLTAYLYTDRPLYRPGESVNAKGILRVFQESGYGLPPRGKVSLAFMDPQGKEIGKREVSLTVAGTFSASFPLPPEARLGAWRLVATCGEKSFEGAFRVEKFRRPEMKVEVKPGKPRFAAGEAVRFEIQGRYYFG
ncbi:MAG: MG2 domain-containing protein, partial [Planctomycetota bacterium]